MQTCPSRRQYSSCDPCRRAKRRCQLPDGVSPPSEGHGACFSCIRLKRSCTFDFAKRHIYHQNKRFERLSRSRQPSTEQQEQYTHEAANLSPEQEHANTAPTLPLDYDLSPGQEPTDAALTLTLDDDPGAALSIGYDILPAIDFDCFDLSSYKLDHASADILDSPLQQTSSETRDSHSDFSASRRHEEADLRRTALRLTPSISNQGGGFWKGSPIRLLNSGLTITILNESLKEMYLSMITGIAARYLSHGCNPFVNGRNYGFQYADQPGFSTVDAPYPASTSDGINMDSMRRLNLIGIAQFLDNFRDFYGNSFNRTIQGQHMRTLLAALQAFSLQWSPSNTRIERDLLSNEFPLSQPPLATALDEEKGSAKSSDIFATAWMNARMNLFESNGHISFTWLCALFLFYTTSIPSEFRFDTELQKHQYDLLDYGLKQLAKLRALLGDYCEHLDCNSVYRTLLEVCGGIMYWWGHVRDSIASMLSERFCTLDDVPNNARALGFLSASLDPRHSPVTSPFLCTDTQICEICQHGVGAMFSLFRKVSRLRMTLKLGDSRITAVQSPNIMNEIFSCIEEFSLVFVPYLDSWITRFETMYDGAKLSVALLVLFWNTGVLSFTEQVHVYLDQDCLTLHSDLRSKSQELEREAVVSLGVVARCMERAPAPRTYKFFAGKKSDVPFVAHHATIALVVLSLVKAVEHTIKYYIAAPLDPGTVNPAENSDVPPINDCCFPSLRAFLACLTDLTKVESGSQEARAAINNLMYQYGDILMDSWAPDTAD